MTDSVPFDVNEEVDLTGEDFSSVPDEQRGATAMPTRKKVKLRIAEAPSIRKTKDGSLTKLGIKWEVVDGIDINGETKFKGFNFYQGGNFFDTVWINADLSVKTGDVYRSGRFRAKYNSLMNALELNPASKLNDDFLSQMKGMMVRAKVKKVQNQIKDDSGNYVPGDGFTNAAGEFETLPIEERI